ncbi:MAG: hypothetical protein ACQCXQ_05670 [Verrucomicrobiales bacterium]|nr:hypothetical protein [Verrucomicrobiota bacterium JB025]
MKLLLGATVALLLGALGMSFMDMTKGVENTSSDEIARLKGQIAQLRAEQDRIKLEKQIQQLKANPAPVLTDTAELDAMKRELEATKNSVQELEAVKNRIERERELEVQEEGLLAQRDLEKSDTELRRARMIAEALLIGRVQEYVEDPQYGGFVTFEVLMPEQVMPGITLAIRRNTGILGTLKVSDVTAEGGIANPMPGFGPIQPQVGDELILPPQY